jgi:hypothetical protein
MWGVVEKLPGRTAFSLVLWYLGAIRTAFEVHPPIATLVVLPVGLWIPRCCQLVGKSIDYFRFSYYTLNESSTVMNC